MITEDLLERIVAEVWSIQLGLDSRPVPVPNQPPEHVVAMRVRISGSWDGHVTVSAGDVAARKIAQAIFGSELDELTPRDLADGIGEVANIVGGNARILLDGKTFIGLPEFAGGGDSSQPRGISAMAAFDMGDDVVVVSARTRRSSLPTPNKSADGVSSTH